MSNEELDREWKPSNRPQSTMARSFSLALNDLFKIDNSLADLDAAVSEKKQKVTSQTSELEALEARIKATEERLRVAASSSPSSARSGRNSPHSRSPITSGTFVEGRDGERGTMSPLSEGFGRDSDGGQKEKNNIPGGFPPTPGASEDGDERKL
ncbi:hypothetical protein BJ878DRAFT_281522 [Calycina marina]|uniref:Uncharacterized protein n=1 Tax=Calycina marina TaxID=1763456 RepID=A0A9P7Z728_9HELO|nr:hypothetical protein BJ878DRAFT_281522 [Calycina marina]